MAPLSRLPEDRMLVEQLRLQLGNIGSSVLPTVLVALLLLIVLFNDDNARAMLAWSAAIIVLKLFIGWHAKHLLAQHITPEGARRLLRGKMVLNALDGAVWGALAWAGLGTTSTTGDVLILAVLASVAGSSMSSLAPTLPLFVVFTLSEMLVMSSKLLAMHDSSYRALAVAALFYVGALWGQARNGRRAARAAIALRFEKDELIDRLRIETEHAQAAHREAEQANLAKSRFLAAASHDLRQPIHAQGLFLEVLVRSPLNPAQRDALDNARATWQASAEMLDTLLDFSRIEAGVVEPQFQAFALQPLLNKIETELAPQADAKGIVYRSRDTRLAVWSDPALVALILRNLVSNAIRYTERGGVLVACRQRRGELLLEVWDTGIGIEPGQTEEIFREFHQLGNAERDRRKGLGLGLAIAQGLARALQHPIEVASRPGQGSVFRMSLPMASMGAGHGGRMPMADHERRLEVRALVIDDDESVRAGMRQLLQAWGCTVDLAETFEEAQALARRNPPAVVISDYRLRGAATGAEAIAGLRAEHGARLPALLITGDTAPQRLREARASGVPLLHKPVSAEQLHHGLIRVLSGQQDLDSAFAMLESRQADGASKQRVR